MCLNCLFAFIFLISHLLAFAISHILAMVVNLCMNYHNHPKQAAADLTIDVELN